MNKLTVTIVIPNWNGKPLLEKYLQTVIAASNNSEIIVVDDGSTDDSIAFLKHNYPKIIIVEKTQHEGYASTVNAGVAAAQGEIVVLLNTDIEPEKDFLKPLIAHFIDSKVFAVGCMDKSYEQGKIILRGRGIGGWEKGFYIHKRGEVDRTDTAWVSGGSGAFRKSIWIKLGGMDELYNPFYWEDIDLSFRSVKAGFRLIFESKSLIHHYHEQGKVQQIYSKQKIKCISYRNQLLFQLKHMPNIGQGLLFMVYMPLYLIRSIFHRDISLFIGFCEAVVLIPKIVRNKLMNKRS